MNLIQCNTLNQEQEQAVRALEQACQAHDGLKGTIFLSNELNFNPNLNCYYFLYEDGQAAAFLSLFMPMQKEAEVSAFTLPGLRRKGCFRALLQQAQAELLPHGIERFLFVTEPQSAAAAEVLHHYGAKYEYSEYLMSYDRSANPQNRSPKPPLRLEPASVKVLDDMVELNVLAFHDEEKEARSLVEKSLQSPERECWCAYLEDRMVGVCSINLEEGSISIYGLAIRPQEQGKGYGRQLLRLLLDRLTARENREITLEVSSTNAPAYHLYLTSGFRVKTQFDYSSRPLSEPLDSRGTKGAGCIL